MKKISQIAKNELVDIFYSNKKCNLKVYNNNTIYLGNQKKEILPETVEILNLYVNGIKPHPELPSFTRNNVYDCTLNLTHEEILNSPIEEKQQRFFDTLTALLNTEVKVKGNKVQICGVVQYLINVTTGEIKEVQFKKTYEILGNKFESDNLIDYSWQTNYKIIKNEDFGDTIEDEISVEMAEIISTEFKGNKDKKTISFAIDADSKKLKYLANTSNWEYPNIRICNFDECDYKIIAYNLETEQFDFDLVSKLDIEKFIKDRFSVYILGALIGAKAYLELKNNNFETAES